MKAHHSIATRYNYVSGLYNHPKFDRVDIRPSAYKGVVVGGGIAYTFDRLTRFTLYPDGVIKDITTVTGTSIDPCIQAWLTEERGSQIVCNACPFQFICIVE